jgi:nitrous oxidase accessory protein NosD
MATQRVEFGSGVLYAKPKAGNLAANPTPYRVGGLQEASVDFKGDLKKAYGQKQFPIATARGKIDVEGKAKLLIFDLKMFNQIYFAQTATDGSVKIADQEIHAFAVSVTATHDADFEENQAVQYADGRHLDQVESGPAEGQYSVDEDTGVYTFSAADVATGGNVKISYSYSSTDGSTIEIANQLMGHAPEVQMFLYNAFRDNFVGVKLNDCTLGQWNIPTKLEDFWMMDLTFSANADENDIIGNLFQS